MPLGILFVGDTINYWLHLLLGFCLALLSLAVSAQDSSYLAQLQQRARDLRLAERKEWLSLLHYKPYPFWPGARSLADGPAFFNAPDGKTNPESELNATLAAFFSDRLETNEQQNPQCSFIARFHWLDAQLEFDAALLPRQPCRRFWAWREALNPHQATLVFPAAYLNNPASMYGHTLIRIDAKDQNEHTRLLAYAIGYAAATNETSGFAFAIKGLIGSYPGVYSIDPYYLKVREYNDIENRDVWEYRLNLTPEEIDRLLMHVWELGPIRFDYYFFDENCSYHLLALLEVARPGLQLTDQFRWWAIPSDTVREVVKQPGLLRETIFRPSKATVIRQRLAMVSANQRGLAKYLATGERSVTDAQLEALPAEQRAQIFELGHDYLAYLKARNGDTPEIGKRLRGLLLARSQIDVQDATPSVPIPETRPDKGHNTSRLGLGWGIRGGQHYQAVVMRPSYHEQNDPEGGYIPGAQIQFFNLAMRHYAGASIRVEEFMPLDIYSLSPSNDYFQSVSWKVNAGWGRKKLASGAEPLLARLNAGAGKTWELSSVRQESWLGYTFLDATLEASSQYQRSYAMGAGPAIGMLGNFMPGWRINIYARVQRFGLGHAHTAAEINLVQRITVGTQSSLRLELSRKQAFNCSYTDAQLAWHQFF